MAAGRKPKLSEDQRAEVLRRYAAGESVSSLSQAYGVSWDTISRISANGPQIREMAQRVAEVETDLATLPPRDQASVRTLAEQLKATSTSLARAAVAGAATSARLAELAQQRVGELPARCTPEDLRPIMALATAGNEAAKTALTLLQANKARATEDRPAPFTPAQLLAMAKEVQE